MGRSDYRRAIVLTFLAAMILLGAAGMTWGQSEGPATRPHLTSRPFNSKLHLRVWAQTAGHFLPDLVGLTPSAEPLEIPSCIGWWVRQIEDTSVEELAREAQNQSIPGLWLSNATDADMAHLKDLKGLQVLGLHGTKVTDAGVAALKAALPGCDIEH